MLLRRCCSLALWGPGPPFLTSATRMDSTPTSFGVSSTFIISNGVESLALFSPNHPSVSRAWHVRMVTNAEVEGHMKEIEKHIKEQDRYMKEKFADVDAKFDAIMSTLKELKGAQTEKLYRKRDLNGFGTLHGGAVGSFVEVLSTACARTVVAEDKDLFLAEMSISYLSATPLNAEVVANASVVKTGRNLTVVTVEFKLKKTGNLLYITHATFYNMPVASL